MSSLTSSSTLDEIKASYVDNASYAEDESTTKAAAFITACRILTLKIPVLARQGDNTIQMSLAEIRQERTAAERWLAANRTDSARVVVSDFRHFR